MQWWTWRLATARTTNERQLSSRKLHASFGPPRSLRVGGLDRWRTDWPVPLVLVKPWRQLLKDFQPHAHPSGPAELVVDFAESFPCQLDGSPKSDPADVATFRRIGPRRCTAGVDMELAIFRLEELRRVMPPAVRAAVTLPPPLRQGPLFQFVFLFFHILGDLRARD